MQLHLRALSVLETLVLQYSLNIWFCFPFSQIKYENVYHCGLIKFSICFILAFALEYFIMINQSC